MSEGLAFTPGLEFGFPNLLRLKVSVRVGEWTGDDGGRMELDVPFAGDKRSESYAWSMFGRVAIQGSIGNDVSAAETGYAWFVPCGVSFSSSWVGHGVHATKAQPALVGFGPGYVGGGVNSGGGSQGDDSVEFASVASQGVGVAAWFRSQRGEWELRADVSAGADLVPDNGSSGIWAAFFTVNTPEFEFVDAFIEATFVQAFGTDAARGNRLDSPLNVAVEAGLRFLILSED